MWFAVVLLCRAMMLDRIYFLRREKEKKGSFLYINLPKTIFPALSNKGMIDLFRRSLWGLYYTFINHYTT
jgi:hypothetical protein